MAAWLPAVKVVLPYLTQIVAAAIPAFTQKTDKGETPDLTRRQIAELQDAVTHNAESIKTLAAQLEQVINDLDAASAKIEKETRTARRLASGAIVLSIAAMLLGIYALVH